MISLSKTNSCDTDCLTFQIAYGYDACLQLKYATVPEINKQVITSKAVSGIDLTRPLTFNLFPISNTGMISMSQIKNSYIISVFRLPYLYTQLVKEVPACVVKVFTSKGNEPPEIWYVMGVRKDFETIKTKSIAAVITNQGMYEKELYRLSGNLPKELVTALKSIRVKNVHYLHSLMVNLPRVMLSNEPVRVKKNLPAERSDKE